MRRCHAASRTAMNGWTVRSYCLHRMWRHRDSWAVDILCLAVMVAAIATLPHAGSATADNSCVGRAICCNDKELLVGLVSNLGPEPIAGRLLLQSPGAIRVQAIQTLRMPSPSAMTAITSGPGILTLQQCVMRALRNAFQASEGGRGCRCLIRSQQPGLYG
jgi:hypothetical protein